MQMNFFFCSRGACKRLITRRQFDIEACYSLCLVWAKFLFVIKRPGFAFGVFDIAMCWQ